MGPPGRHRVSHCALRHRVAHSATQVPMTPRVTRVASFYIMGYYQNQTGETAWCYGSPYNLTLWQPNRYLTFHIDALIPAYLTPQFLFSVSVRLSILISRPFFLPALHSFRHVIRFQHGNTPPSGRSAPSDRRRTRLRLRRSGVGSLVRRCSRLDRRAMRAPTQVPRLHQL